jgi:hypothetical protein
VKPITPELRAAAIAFAEAMTAWADDDDDIHKQPMPTREVFDLARYGAERAIDDLTDYALELPTRFRIVAAMLRAGWCPGDPVDPALLGGVQ